jgi:lipopolysaccharide/colanic/teichoic acid biosynthesis glycosyltransferase
VISRALDLTIGLAASIVTAPLVLVLALAVRLETRGDPIYRQTRIGKDGRPFEIYKLRTMITGAEFTGAGLAVAEGDTRITRVGALLRRYSLDELPNLWNVVRGEMAIVGPRPTLEAQVLQYTPRQRGRLAVRPGITGWAQVNGRASLPWPERIELDLWYVEHRSLALDLSILGKTVEMVARGHGIYKGENGGWQPPNEGADGGWRPTSDGADGGWQPPKEGTESGWQPPKEGTESGWQPPKEGTEGGWQPPNQAP